MLGLLKNIANGVFSGIVTAFLGYLKNSKDEEFDAGKFVQTLIIGGIVGAVAQVAGMTYESAYDYLMSIGVITLTQYLLKTLYRRLLPYIKHETT